MSDSKPPRAPNGLGTAGAALWRSVVTDFELRADELLLLESAARLRDEIVWLEQALATVPTLTNGSKGQEKPHPLFAEVRQHRLALARILAGLGLGDAAGDAVNRSNAGRKLAAVRWKGSA